jgi:hypothetical protein
VARNANKTVAVSDGDCIWRESGVRRSVLSWCFSHESGFSRREDVFYIDLINKFPILYFQCDLQR